MFVYNAALLMIGSLPFIVWSFFTGVLGTLALSVALEGYLITRASLLSRFMFAVAGVAALVPEVWTDGLGLPLLFVLTLMNVRKARSEGPQGVPAIS